MKKLKIAQLAPLWIPVPPITYGGIELMVHNLTERLVGRGHDVTLFASGDSKSSADLIAPIDKAIWLQKGLRNPHAAIIKMADMVKNKALSFDVIHNHFNFFMFPITLCNGLPPILTTIHRPIDDHFAEIMKIFSDKVSFCALSEDAKKSAEEYGIPIIDVVPNGIDLEKYPFSPKAEDYFLYLGRLNKGEGVVTALRAAKKAGKKLVVAGNVVGGEEWNYFMQEVQPLLNDSGVNFVGQANFEQKIKLLRGAKALLFPIEHREAFGLVMIEAMACGAPVIAFRNGSVPEVVEDGKTGFIVNSEDEIVSAMKRTAGINRADCRKRAEDNFNLNLMLERYEKLYARMLNL